MYREGRAENSTPEEREAGRKEQKENVRDLKWKEAREPGRGEGEQEIQSYR